MERALAPLDPHSALAPTEGRNVLLEAHRRLRGRYVWAAVTAAALAPAFAAIGWLAVKPEYQSTGIVRIAPTLPRVLYDSEENSLPPLFDSFVSAQATYLRSRRVIDRAMDPAFRVPALGDRSLVEAGWPENPGGAVRLQKNLAVGFQRGFQLITVSVSDQSPALAQSAVNAVLHAYEELYGEEGEVAQTARERILQDRERRLDLELNSIIEDIWRVTEKQGPETIQRLHEAKINELQRIDEERMVVETALVQATHRTAPPEEGEEAPDVQSEEFLARRDPLLARLLDDRDALRMQIERLSAVYGPAHRDVSRRRTELDVVERQVADRVALLLENGAPGVVLDPAASLAEMTPPQLQGMLDQLTSIRARVAGEAEALGEKQQTIARRRQEADDTRKRLDETRQALEAIRVENEGTHSGRISIAQYGDLPIAPSSDRRIALALGGAMAGVGMGVGLFLLVGFVDRRYRFSDELTGAATPPRLGVLPELDSADDVRQEQARIAVHQIRNLLSSTVRSHGGCRVICVTSPRPGDGKTSLVMSLGLSFASGGDRTLLLDADLIGRGLTRSLSLDTRPGLRDLLEERRPIDDSVASVYPGLSVIPSGSTADFAPENVSHTRFGHLVADLRKRYDTIVIDTGPLLGSVEADLAAALSDSTVLVVARGQEPGAVHECFRRLSDVGRPCAGYVFNRATTSDVVRSSSGMSVSRAAGNALALREDEGSDLMSALLSNVRLGRLLLRMGKVTQTQLAEALDVQEETGQALGRVLVELGYVTEQDVAYAVQSQRRLGTDGSPGAESARAVDRA